MQTIIAPILDFLKGAWGYLASFLYGQSRAKNKQHEQAKEQQEDIREIRDQYQSDDNYADRVRDHFRRD
jgi:hypothetical protein